MEFRIAYLWTVNHAIENSQRPYLVVQHQDDFLTIYPIGRTSGPILGGTSKNRTQEERICKNWELVGAA